MKKNFTWILIVALFAAYAASTLRTRKDKGPYQVQAFAALPVVLNGRVQPFDSMARNSLLVIRGNTAVPLEGNSLDGRWGSFEELGEQGQQIFFERKWYQFSKHPKKLGPTEWLLEVLSRPEDADQRYLFLINHPELKTELGLEGRGLDRSGLTYFRYADIRPKRQKLMADANVVSDKKAEQRTPFEKEVNKVAQAVILYERLKNSMQTEHSRDFAANVVKFPETVAKLRAAFRETGSTEVMDESGVQFVTEMYREFEFLSAMAYPFIIPPAGGSHDRENWQNMGASLTNSLQSAELHPATLAYAKMVTAYQEDKAADFNQAVTAYRGWMQENGFETELKKGSSELFFNNYAPFRTSIVIYIVAFLMAAYFLFSNAPGALRGASWLIGLALVVHTSGLIFRMVLEGRPPVTNLYSSAIFIGWGTVVLGLFIERFWKNGIGSLVASKIGVITLIIAHNLSLDGDTMEMLQAVLDTNFWLATHVVVITLGYSAMFLAGLLGALYLLLGVFTPKLNELVGSGRNTLGKAITKNVYGIICFATLFSFVGTVLGGIWADQSWGRFWGWDPKENGALMIVLWCAIILHARWGGLVREKGLMVLAIAGNIITAFSWFGVNMLGVGLHSYGFMDEAFKWLMIFNISQLALMSLALVPDRSWRSGLSKAGAPPSEKPAAPPRGKGSPQTQPA